MVSVKYFISQQTLTHKDGSLQEGLVVDYTIVQKELQQLTLSPSIPLLAFNSLNTVADGVQASTPSPSHTDQAFVAQVVSTDGYVVNEAEELEGPAPVEYANTLVVYNPSSPVPASYADQDDSSPMDHSNTIVNEMQLMMPRR